MSYILDIGTATPEFRYTQQELAAPLQALYPEDSAARRKIPAILRKSSIDYRYSVLKDFNHNDQDSFYIFENGSTCLPDVGQRMQEFKIKSIPLANKAITDLFSSKRHTYKLSEVTHFIAVSCTGLSAPGLEILIPESLGMTQNIQRYTVNFMGCYAAFHGLKLADLICNSDPKALVLVVCVELSTLHMRRDESDDNLLSSGLFADGAASLLISSEKNTASSSIQILEFNSTLIRDADADMQWNIAPDGFKMALNANIPSYISKYMGNFYDQLLEKTSYKRQNIKHFAIHPGGRKILEAFAQSLNIEPERLIAAFHVLRNYGNMSSPTVLFVLKELWVNHFTAGREETIFSAAFGPGLTVETAFLKHVVG